MKNKIIYFLLGALSALGAIFTMFIYWFITDNGYRSTRHSNTKPMSYSEYYRMKKNDFEVPHTVNWDKVKEDK